MGGFRKGTIYKACNLGYLRPLESSVKLLFKKRGEDEIESRIDQ